MKRKKTGKILLLIVLGGALIGVGIVFYMYNMPHRNIAETTTDHRTSAGILVEEYLKNPDQANKKYLDEEGESNIFEIKGEVKEIAEDFDGQQVVLLQSSMDKAGVSCTFTKETNPSAKKLKIGQRVIIKGVIRSGAAYDPDLEMYENVVLDKCSIIH